MRIIFFICFLVSFWACGSTVFAATVSSPCNLSALKSVLPGGPNFDGTINFACDQNDEVIEIDQAFDIGENVAIDGSNLAGSGNQVVLRAADQPQCTITTIHRLFMIEANVAASIQNLHIQWFRADDRKNLVESAGDHGGAIYNRGTLVLDNVTFSGNVATGMGGAIFSEGDLTVRNSQLGVFDSTDYTNCVEPPDKTPPNPYGPNRAGMGGAIAIADSQDSVSNALIADTDFYYNIANQGGSGSLWVESRHDHAVDLQLIGSSLVEGNGALYASGPLVSVKVENSTIEGHSTTEDPYTPFEHVIASFGASVALNNSTIVRNATRRGAIAITTWPSSDGEPAVGGEMVIVNSTIAANTAWHEGAADFGTAGVVSYDATKAANPKPSVTLINSTVARNKSFQFGRNPNEGNALIRGVNVGADGGLVTLVNSIIADALVSDYDGLRIAEPIGGDANCGTAGQEFSMIPEISAEGINLDSDGSCIEFVGSGEAFLTGAPTPPGLADEDADNGGATNTIALLANSAAIDAADNEICGDSDTVNNRDQRNAPRNFAGEFGESCDIGAFEFDSTPITPSPSPSPTPSASPTANPTPTPTQTPQVSATPSPTGAGGDNGSGSLDLLLCLLGLSLGLRRLQIAVGFIRGNLLYATRRSR